MSFRVKLKPGKRSHEWIGVAMPGDDLRVMEAMDKQANEALQTDSFLRILIHEKDTAPLTSITGGDPPDRIIYQSDKQWATELSQLTKQSIRDASAIERSISEKLLKVLNENKAQYSHLQGKLVHVAVIPSPNLLRPKKVIQQVKLLGDMLLDDKGCVDENQLIVNGELPKKLNLTRGVYTITGSFITQVYSYGVPGEYAVDVREQREISLEESLQTMTKKVQEKDIYVNEILLMTCGLPNQQGYVSEADPFIYHDVMEAFSKKEVMITPPKYLEGVVLHLWGTSQWLEVYKKRGALMPWNV